MPRYLGPIIIVAALFAALSVPPPVTAAGLPAGFEEQTLARLSRATVLTITSDGRLLVGQQTGQVRVIKGGALLPTPALSLGSGTGGLRVTCSGFERGLLGMTVDPQFASNSYVYIFYTYCVNNNPVSNRVARFTMQGDILDYASQLILIDNIIATGPYHQGGSLRFGADGYLYAATGDNYTQGVLSQNMGSLNGKILRIDPATGRGVAGNPYLGAANSQRCGAQGASVGVGLCEEIFAWGLRNPFRIAFRPNSSAFYINDVGQRTWEEVDRGGVGINYGWPQYEGPCLANSGCLDPANQAGPEIVYYYRHGTTTGIFAGGCAAITGGAFVPPGVWPAEYDGDYLFGDYVCGRIFRLNHSSGAASVFAGAFGDESVADMLFGPDGPGRQALYYVSYGGAIGIVRYTGSVNRAPEAKATASPITGRTPLTVAFDGSASSDPEGQPLSYSWSFGDGTSGSGPNVSHTYNVTGTFMVTLTVSDGSRSTVSTPIMITPGNLEPTATITTPQPVPYSVGQTITLQGRASDPEDGTLPADQLIWDVWLHHDAHVHPVLSDVTSDTIALTMPRPEDLAAVTTSYLEVWLTAVDSKGLRSEKARMLLMPQIVTLSLTTQPPGLALVVNGVSMTSPATVQSWPGYVLSIGAPAQMTGAGQRLILTSWSDAPGGGRALVSPTSDTSYEARFEPSLYDMFLALDTK